MNIMFESNYCIGVESEDYLQNKRKEKVKDTFRRCIKKVMLMNSIRRGHDIILQTTSKEDKTFHQFKNIIGNKGYIFLDNPFTAT